MTNSPVLKGTFPYFKDVSHKLCYFSRDVKYLVLKHVSHVLIFDRHMFGEKKIEYFHHFIGNVAILKKIDPEEKYK